MMQKSTSVLVVGGGLAGLSQAMFLAARGVPTMLVERQKQSSPHPRATGFTPRTMELFDAVGIVHKIPQAPRDFNLQRCRVESLAGKWFEESSWSPKPKQQQQQSAVEYSPFTGAAMAQDRLEPILQAKAIELGADVQFQTECLQFEQSSKGVQAIIRNLATKEEVQVDAKYLVAADGHRSKIRQTLGIGRTGTGHLRTMRSVLFRAPLDEYLEKGISQFNIDQPDLKAFLTTYRDGRWVLMFSDDQERDESTLRQLIHKAIGRSDLPVEIITTGRWELGAFIADRFSIANTFLIGDAAHTLPPSRGGFGANTGIDDAHNLAWKLSAVLSGESKPRLLETYDAERRPIAWLRHDQIFARPDYSQYAKSGSEPAPIIDDSAMEFGQLYRSAAVVGADATLPPAMRPDQWVGQPGTRAPHMWMADANGKQISLLDLLQQGWVLLSEHEIWHDAALHARDITGIQLKFVRVGVDVHPSCADEYRAALGLKNSGAVLIRPDGYIAWRASEAPNEAAQALATTLAEVAATN